jgi:Tol biopolymer transport system component
LRDQRKHNENTVPLDENAVVLTQELRYQRDKLRQAVWEAIDELTADYREAVILHYISGYSYKEISEMLSVPVSTVQGRLQQARNHLRKEFMDMVTKLQLEIDSTLHNFLREHAEQNGTSIEGLIVRLIERYKREMDTGVSEGRGVGTDLRLIYNPTGDKPSPTFGSDSDFSPTGKQIVFRSQKRLYMADGTGTVIRSIRDDWEPWWIGQPTWSPDGRLIAYGADKSLPDKETSPDLVSAVFVIDPEDGTPRQISPEYLGERVRFTLWSPDSQYLAYQAKDGVHTVDLDGTEVRFVPKEELPGWIFLLCCDYSPDGRWLAGPSGGGRRQPGTDICVLPVTEDGFATEGHPLNLSFSPRGISYCRWAPDGRTLYFVAGSGHPEGLGATWNIWKLPMDPNTGDKEGEAQQVTFFREAAVHRPKMLGDSGRIGFGLTTVSMAIQVADTSRPDEVRTLAVGSNPQLSPDGKTIYYVDDRPGEEGIYAVPWEGGTPQRLTESRLRRASMFDLSPDGQVFAYVTNLDEGRGLFTLPASGGLEPQLLVEFDRRMSVVPQWSPDGSQLAYAYGSGLYVIPAAGGQPRELAHLAKWEGWTVRWSPDGKFIAAFGRPKRESGNAVFVVSASGGELRQLTPDVEYKEGLEWHPDGQRLTYHVSRSESETRQAYLDGRPPTLLFDDPDGWDYVGAWTPDGNRFFFVCDIGQGNWDIRIYDEASGDITPFSTHAGNARTVPCFSRDGKIITWSTREKVVQLWTMEDFQPELIAAK